MTSHSSLETSTICIEKEVNIDDNPILKYRICYPQFSSSKIDKNIDVMNRYYLNNTLEYEAYIQDTLLPWAIQNYYSSIQNNFMFNTYEAIKDFNITYNQDGLLSLYTDTYEFTGGAHGNTFRTSETWDLMCGIMLPLCAFFDNGNYIDMITNAIILQINEQMATQDIYFEDYAETVKKSFDPKNFYISPGFINTYFQLYEIAPYSVGIPVFKIPL